MSIEEQVHDLIDGAADELTLAEVHDLLLRIAEISGGRPQAVTGPGPSFSWRFGDRGQTVSVYRFRGRLSLSHETFDWAEHDDEEYRTFKWAEVPNLPYLWRLPIAGGYEWAPGGPVPTSWRAFFSCFEGCLDRLPGDLQLIPPAWRPAGAVVTSMWNIDGPVYGSASLAVSDAGITLECYGAASVEPLQLEIPADRLGAKQVSMPALLASLTASGDYRELQFFENETVMDVFPAGIQKDDPWFDPDDFPDPGAPKRTQTVDEVRALLAPPPAPGPPSEPIPPAEPSPPTAPSPPTVPAQSTAPIQQTQPAQSTAAVPPIVAPSPTAAAPGKPARKPWWRRGAKPSPTAFVPTMAPEHAVELVSQLALNNHDVPAVLAAWECVLDEGGHGTLRLGFVQCRRAAGTAYSVAVELMPTDREIDDLSGATAYARQLKDGLKARFGVPQAEAASRTTGSFAWKVGSVGVVMELDATRVAVLAVADGDRAVSLVQAAAQPPTG